MNEIVVGLDLSPSARVALRWAAGQARVTGQNLRAVHAVDVSPTFNMAVGMGAVAVPMHASAMDTAYRDANTAVFDSIQPEASWRLEFYAGKAGPVLVAESVGEALLVVGTREDVGLGRLIFGSVSHHCLSHAQCSVVAVPAIRADGAEDHGNDLPAADTRAHT